jgi:hypothetical protein
MTLFFSPEKCSRLLWYIVMLLLETDTGIEKGGLLRLVLSVWNVLFLAFIGKHNASASS